MMKNVIFKTSIDRITSLLFVMSIFCFCLTVFRALMSSTAHYLFLNKNLFLSFIPWLISSVILKREFIRKCYFLKWTLFLLWLVFFPNSLYIFTDLFHLGRPGLFPLWYDFILITSFAWTGFMFGIISLLDIEKFFINFVSRTKVNIILALLLFLGSFGVYIGRFLRWNSWDVVMQPFALFVDVSDKVTHPFIHKGTWGMTLLLGVMLNMIFWSVRMIQNKAVNKGKFQS
jgi:uncharacterized membrane protein